jgi:ADP-ribosylglycohydrolase
MSKLDELNPSELIGKKAWEIDRLLRLRAVPLDRRKHGSNWQVSAGGLPSGDDQIALFWGARVPGSGAPEIPYVEMVQSMGNRGFETLAADELLPEGLRLAAEGCTDDLRRLTAQLLATLNDLYRDPLSPYWSYQHPAKWGEVQAAMGKTSPDQEPAALVGLDEKIFAGWLGQIAGGAFGTAIEGYHSTRIQEVYGAIDTFVTDPETMNDDIVYELVLLDVFERSGRRMSSVELGLEWVRQIPFGWSAEWIALHNLGEGILPPLSGTFRNPYSDWIGAQMRGMVCGMLAPGWPMEAARLAHVDARISHAANGIYGEIYAAVLTALAFVRTDVRELLAEAAEYVPQRSEYAAVVQECLETVRATEDPAAAWVTLDRRFEQYNWIHAYPNLAADILALWYGGGDITRSFSLLAHAGMDVDCNAGLVGNVLGIMTGVQESWSAPIGDRLETYVKGKEVLSIRTLAERTARLARM